MNEALLTVELAQIVLLEFQLDIGLQLLQLDWKRLPWVPRDERLREANNIGAIDTGFLDEGDCLRNASLEVVPYRLSLDSSDLDMRHGNL